MFNIFKILNTTWEEPNNRILSWLLNPDGNHGLNYEFLSGFLEHFKIIPKGKVNIVEQPWYEGKDELSF